MMFSVRLCVCLLDIIRLSFRYKQWVNCPLTLDIPISDGKECNKMVKYVLYAAVIHSGRSAEFGHYYTIGRHSYDTDEKGKWFMFNDRRVTLSDYEKLCKVSKYYNTDVPYLLFYKLMDEELDKSKNADKCDKEKGADHEWEDGVGKELAQFTSQ